MSRIQTTKVRGMSVALSSCLRRHFFKRLTPCNVVTHFFSFPRGRRGFRRLPSPNRFSYSPIAEGQPQQLLRLNTNLAHYSTPLFAGATDDSFTSPYLSVRISCPLHVADVFSESLMCFGATSTSIDQQDSYKPDGQIWISSTFSVDIDVKDCIWRAADSVGLKERPMYKVEMHDHTDWIKHTQDLFHPVEIMDGLWIVPEWRCPPDPQGINIILNPGLAFGTGEHPTTKLCLLLLHRSMKEGQYFLDYGTGSGVLAIAALKFGAEISVGFDVEQQAITAARHNAALNNIGPEKLLLSLVPPTNSLDFESMDCVALDSLIIAEKDKYDVIIANILMQPLLDLADHIVSYAKPGAIVGVSGIISEQVPAVMERYSKLLQDMNVSMMDDWACISGSKK